VPFSTLQYNTNKEEWRKWYPPDFVLECFPGQFRNWFYSLLSLSTMMRYRPPGEEGKHRGTEGTEKGEQRDYGGAEGTAAGRGRETSAVRGTREVAPSPPAPLPRGGGEGRAGPTGGTRAG
jgi:hypothetical protein